MKMEILPHKSFGNLRFGDSREVARKLLNDRCFPFQKHAGQTAIDVASESGLHLHYNDDDLLEFVEAFEPAIVTFNGVEFLGRDAKKVIADMLALGYSPQKTDVGVRYEAAGIALTLDGSVVDSVAAYRRGYYDDSV